MKLERLQGLASEVAALGIGMLVDPQAVIAVSDPLGIDETVRREFAMFSVGLDSDGNAHAVQIDIRAEIAGSGRFAPTTSVEADVTVYGTSQIVAAMEALYLRTTPATRTKMMRDTPRGMWLGGDVDDGTLPADAEDQIGAVLAVRGFRPEVVRRPLRTWSSVKQRLDNDPPAVALIWTPYATPAPYHEIAAGRFAVLDLDEPEFVDALMLGRLLLDDLDDEGDSRPRDWDTFAERMAALECDAFVITPNARQGIKGTGYPHPARMWDHLEALARAATAFRESDGVVGGRLAEWIGSVAGIEVALHDDNLSEGDTRFVHDGAEHSREPHVKVHDAKAWIEVGRIYFAVDSDGGRFIVDHIGGKLY